MPTINISSLPGIHQNSNVTTGGGTDDTAVIQAALDAGPFPLTLVQDGASLITGLDISSNTTLKCNNSSQGFYLANASNREIIRNKNRSATVITDHDITLDGGFYNGNKANQSGVSQSDNTPMIGLGFYGIRNLNIQNSLEVFDSAAWNIGISNFDTVLCLNISTIASTAVSNLNTDGIDLRGPGTNAALINMTIISGDDGIALNARNYGSGITGPFIGGGTISNVRIDTINFNGCFAGIDLIAEPGNLVQDVYMIGVGGNVQNYALYCNRDLFNTPPATAPFSNIIMVGDSVVQSGTPFGGLIPSGLLLVDGNIDYLRMSSFTPLSQTLKFTTSAGSATSLILYDQQRGPVTGPLNVGMQNTNFVQAAQVTPISSGSSISKASPGNTFLGTTLVVFVFGFFSGGATITSISDTIGNSYTQRASFTDGATGHVAAVYTCKNKSSGANTVTVNFSASTAACGLEIAEYGDSSVENTSTLNFDVASETTVTCPSITTQNTNDLVLGVGSTVGTGITGQAAGFSARLTGATSALGVLIDGLVSAFGASSTPSWTQAANAGNYNSTLVLRGQVSQGLWAISGNAGVGGATVSYSGTGSGSVVADSTGNFIITGLSNGSYTVTPSLVGYSFTPSPPVILISNQEYTSVQFTATHLHVSTPTISPNGGNFPSSVLVTLNDTDSGLTGFAMYYTTDGSTPTTASTLYTVPFTVTPSLTVKVLAVATGFLDSTIASASFVHHQISGGSGLGYQLTYGF